MTPSSRSEEAYGEIGRRPLYEEIRHFRRWRLLIGPVLILIGLLGLIFPVLPGLLLLFLGFALLFPKESEKLVKKIRKALRLDRLS